MVPDMFCLKFHHMVDFFCLVRPNVMKNGQGEEVPHLYRGIPSFRLHDLEHDVGNPFPMAHEPGIHQIERALGNTYNVLVAYRKNVIVHGLPSFRLYQNPVAGSLFFHFPPCILT